MSNTAMAELLLGKLCSLKKELASPQPEEDPETKDCLDNYLIGEIEYYNDILMRMGFTTEELSEIK